MNLVLALEWYGYYNKVSPINMRELLQKYITFFKIITIIVIILTNPNSYFPTQHTNQNKKNKQII